MIIAGDLNLNTTDRPNDVKIFETLLTTAGFVDVCRSLSCGTELVDRVLFRNSNSLALKAISWELDENFVDELGRDLSDHSAVSVRFKWEFRKLQLFTTTPLED